MRTRRVKEGKKKKSDRMPGLKSLAERGGWKRREKKKLSTESNLLLFLKRPGENTAHTIKLEMLPITLV